jgi:hypothetical protein
VQVRFRVDEKQHRPYARSEYRITEIVEDMCNKNLLSELFVSNITVPDHDHLRVLVWDHNKPKDTELAALGYERRRVGVQKICRYLNEYHHDTLVPMFHDEVVSIANRPYHEVCVGVVEMCDQAESTAVAQATFNHFNQDPADNEAVAAAAQASDKTEL